MTHERDNLRSHGTFVAIIMDGRVENEKIDVG